MSYLSGLFAAVLAVPGFAAAGPWCGGQPGWSPASGELPAHAHLVFYRQDRVHGARVPKLPFRATIDGKHVDLAVHDVHSGDYLLQFIDVKSERTGKLEIEVLDQSVILHDDEAHHAPHESATFTVVADGQVTKVAATKLTATTERYHRLVPVMIHRYADGLAISVDGPAIAFDVRWRRDGGDDDHDLVLPAITKDGHATAYLGQTDCGADTVPLGFLEQGLDLWVTVRLPDGTKQELPLPRPVMLPH